MSLAKHPSSADEIADAVGSAKSKLTFDDLQLPAAGWETMPANYGGLTWSSDWIVADPKILLAGDGYDGSGFFKGRTSGRQIAYNDSGNPVSVSATGQFDLKKVELTAGTNTKLVVDIYAYQGSTQVAHDRVTLSDAHATLVKLDFGDVTRIEFVPGKATADPKFSDTGTYIVFDDMTVAHVQNGTSAAPARLDPTHAAPDAVNGLAVHLPEGLHLVHPIA